MTAVANRVRAGCAVLLAAAVAAAGCGGSGDESRPVRPIATQTPATTFAPLVSFHQDERWWPIAAHRFIDYSSFKWQNSPCVIDQGLTLGAPRIQLRRDSRKPATLPARLGGQRGQGPYRIRPRTADCSALRAVTYLSNQHTRPYDSSRPPELRDAEGFQLDLLTAQLHGHDGVVRAGGQALYGGVPVYYEQAPERGVGPDGLRITYWLLYGFDSPQPEQAGRRFWHEGDWERVSVLLRPTGRPDRYLPLSVRYHQGGRVVDVPWGSVELASDTAQPSHPVVYAALGSHTPYSDADTRTVRRQADGRAYELEDATEACDDCPEWRTWKLMRPLRREPWYGYGGSWGRPFEDDERSGPLGPSPFVAPSGEDGASAEQRIERAAAGLHDDLEHGRFAEVCAALARRPRVEVGSVGHNVRPTTCTADLRDFVQGTEQSIGIGFKPRSMQRSPRPRVTAVALAPGARRAEVTMTLRGGDPYIVPFVEEDGQWKLDDFFGATGPITKGLR